ncbi:uncharacterized protein LOC107153114 isoform X1 [Marmota marmota marmota]|uniref:uncharacterized protein LOC107153114 isoform X1 n=1 Tax=Marmota marmota marmota TaxID=9994 RepID=UPI002092EF73|nr:uncharacterized protein LOC107153114 isoform X1 [Marmota marmota marmota]
MRGQRQAISRGRSPWLPDWPLCGHAGHGGSLSRCVQPHRAAFTPSPPSEASSEPGHSLEVTARDRHDLQEARFPPPCCALPVGFPHQPAASPVVQLPSELGRDTQNHPHGPPVCRKPDKQDVKEQSFFWLTVSEVQSTVGRLHRLGPGDANITVGGCGRGKQLRTRQPGSRESLHQGQNTSPKGTSPVAYFLCHTPQSLPT